jgi:hypothetical protein
MLQNGLPLCIDFSFVVDRSLATARLVEHSKEKDEVSIAGYSVADRLGGS